MPTSAINMSMSATGPSPKRARTALSSMPTAYPEPHFHLAAFQQQLQQQSQQQSAYSFEPTVPVALPQSASATSPTSPVPFFNVPTHLYRSIVAMSNSGSRDTLASMPSAASFTDGDSAYRGSSHSSNVGQRNMTFQHPSTNSSPPRSYAQAQPQPQPQAQPQAQQQPANASNNTNDDNDYNYSGDEAEMFEESNRYKHLYNPDSVLMQLVNSYNWAGTYARVSAFPRESKVVGEQGRTPLHVACDHDAPASVVGLLLRAYPEASLMVGTSNMNPLHITCSSPHASVHVVRTLLEGGYHGQTSMRDVDGDTPLHAACRCDAPIEVIHELLRANPAAVHERDYEGLTPMLRLWVRYFVILGDDVIDNVKTSADLVGELGEAWRRTMLLLRYAYAGSITNDPQTQSTQQAAENSIGSGSASRNDCETDLIYHSHVLHAASTVDCPRAVVKIATTLYRQQLKECDKNGMTPLHIAAMAPIYQVRDLSDGGYTLEDQILGDDATASNESHAEDDHSTAPNQHNADAAPANATDTTNPPQQQPQPQQKSESVIDILLSADPEAAKIRYAKTGQLPLHMAIGSGKQWNEGTKQLWKSYPNALTEVDPKTGLMPAFNPSANIGTIYELLRKDPSVVQF